MKLHYDPHYNATIKPRGKRTGKRGWFGVEIETEPATSYTSEDALLCRLPDESKAGMWAVPDGSLDCGGIEFNTQPATLSELFKIVEPLYSAMAEAEYTSEYNSRHECGLHVHISRVNFGITQSAQNIAAYKISRSIERHAELFEKFAGRRFNHWARVEHMENIERSFEHYGKKPVRAVSDSIQEWTDACEGSHSYGNPEWTSRKYTVLNYQHPETFELRISGGKSTFEAFKAYMYMVQGLVNLVKRRNLSTEWFETCTTEEFQRELALEIVDAMN